MRDLEDIFGPHGPLQRALPDFRVRREQLAMAGRVAEALEARAPLVVEAGTGTGKTFAYLVPALLSGLRVLISTGTRTLQDQLFGRDLPLVAGALGLPARVALLKGRANYLCRYRLERSGAQLALEIGAAPPGRMLSRIERWARTTKRGDLAEVSGLADSHPVWPQVTSTRDNCLGMRCPDLKRCHVVAARREAQEADVVIVNHHLLLADLALKEDGFGDLLGSADAVILDEAHQIGDLATQFFGATVSGRQIDHLLRDMQLELAAAGDSAALAGASAALRGADEAVRELIAHLPRALGRHAWDDTPSQARDTAEDLSHVLNALGSELETLESHPALVQAGERAIALSGALERIAAREADDGARTVEITPRGFVLSLLPFDIAERFRSLVDSRPCSWIFTSATLSVAGAFDHFTGRLGLRDADTLAIASPFDYERQGVLLLPEGLPSPSSPRFVEAVIETALPLVEAARGGAFVLFTSHRALAQAAALLKSRWREAAPFNLYVQGDQPREQLLRAFREDGRGVLLGTASFWEGVDVKGQALRLVVIEKLPFASPDDPIVKARIAHLQANGGNAFRDFQLPEAALALKQGVGRLVRSEDDYGVVVLCDPRVRERAYGRAFIEMLPPFRITAETGEAVRFLRRHAPAPQRETA